MNIVLEVTLCFNFDVLEMIALRKFVYFILIFSLFVSCNVLNKENSIESRDENYQIPHVLNGVYKNSDENSTLYIDYPNAELYILDGYMAYGVYFDLNYVYYFNINEIDKFTYSLDDGVKTVVQGISSREEQNNINGLINLNQDGSIILNMQQREMHMILQEE